MNPELWRKFRQIFPEGQDKPAAPLDEKYARELRMIRSDINHFETVVYRRPNGEEWQRTPQEIADFVEQKLRKHCPEIEIERTSDHTVIGANMLDPVTWQPGYVIYSPKKL